jgi:micrococcal nuclease
MGILRSFAVLGLSVSLSLLFGLDPSNAAEKLPEARVIAVNDGDTVTIMMNNREYRVRLIGMDAPEMGQEPWGKRAQDHLRMLLKDVRWRVSVETDVEKYDKYDRLLAYLWTPDGEMLNERMVRDGYAVLFTIQPNSKYRDRFRKAQRIAREEKRGIWGPDGLKEAPLDYKKRHPRQQHFRDGEMPISFSL